MSDFLKFAFELLSQVVYNLAAVLRQSSNCVLQDGLNILQFLGHILNF